jgi:predicted AlkP superfamily pyrophosphatase or phosphodiesterase
MSGTAVFRLVRALWVAVACALAFSAHAQTPQGPRPRLVVVMVVDGLPQWQALKYRDQLAPNGLKRFLDRGAWFANAHHGHAHTVTAAGHATILTGAPPRRTGIIANEWRDPQTLEEVYNTADSNHVYIDHRTGRNAGTSPKNLLAESLGDVLRAGSPDSKVIGISGKDRGAILPAGKTGTAYMYMAETGRFASSTYYMREHPAWVTAFNDAQPAARYLHATWSPLLPEAAYARSLPDNQPWYGPGGRLPKVYGEISTKPDASLFASLLSSPFGDELVFNFARAALAGESLGRDEATDILSISLSGHDYINHNYGAESRLSHDHLLRLDRMIESFFRELDKSVGARNYLALLTSDHGFTPVPEHRKSLGLDAGRPDLGAVLKRLEAGLAARFGTGPWVRGWSAEGIILDNRLIAARGIDRAAFDEESLRLLRGEENIVAAYTRAEIQATDERPPTNDASGAGKAAAERPFLEAIRKAWHPERSADIQIVIKPYYLWGSQFKTGTTHGSAHEYDSHVPILLYGPRWIGRGRVETRVETTGIAPTLAAMLGLRPPSQNEGHPLPLPRIR